jgi:2-C-methyl-D-erythritol 4-phosphate cytidylyltransferase/2-C-methyl-D-erythritol 2,4-cyclodiphosphate synthase
MKYSDFTVVLLCAGKGERAKLEKNKIFYDLGGITVFEKALCAFEDFENVVVVCSAIDESELRRYFSGKIVLGGKTRGESSKAGLKAVNTKYALIHDCARPFVNKELIERVARLTEEKGCAVPIIKEKNSLKKTVGDALVSVNRDDYAIVQTPQGFETKKLLAAYENADFETDDSAVYEKAGNKVFCCEGDENNVKLTTPEDFRAFPLVGIGYDVHRLVSGRKLILGGVEIPHYLGLDGHSDADALVHAIMDAILSAAGLPDIGNLFPDNDDKYLGADSCDLLKQTLEKIKPRKVRSVSAVIMAQKPKMSPFIPKMREKLAGILNVDYSCVNVSATTTEKLGICGEEKGIAAQAIAVIE